MQKNSIFKGKAAQFLMLLSIIFSTVVTPVATIAETVDSSTQSSLVADKAEQAEQTSESSEIAHNKKEETTLESSFDSTEGTNSETAKANDSPAAAEKATEEERDTVDLIKIEELANRPSPTKYDTTGLTNAEIEKLGLAIFGTFQPFGTSVTMDNDRGEAVNIPFYFRPQTREIGSSSRFNMSYVLTGFGTTSRYPSIAHHYVDSRYAFCMDPNTLFVNGANYAPQEMDISNETYRNVNDVLNFGATDASDDIASGYTALLVWSRIGWDVTEVGGIGSLDGFRAYQAQVEAKIQQWYKAASFNGQTVTLRPGESTTLTDTNNSLKDMNLLANSTGTQLTHDGNKLTIKSASNTNQDGEIAFIKPVRRNDTALIWTSPGSQSVATPGKTDPAPTITTVSVKILKDGNFRIRKVDKVTGAAIPGTKYKVEFTGTNAPATKTVTTDKDGYAEVKDVPFGVHAKFTEIFVPAPYVLGSAVGDTDVYEADVKPGETVELTAKNTKALGQIVIDKSGVETGKNPWNGNYQFTNTTFEIHKDKVDGDVVKTVTLDTKGNGQTPKDLPLGTYWVVEKTAGTGYANTFKPVKVDLTYANQTQAVVINNAKGTNQEVVGEVILTKTDAETGKEAQGKATLKGAEYTLFHKDGTPVKWSENFKPELVEGKAVGKEDVVIRIDDKSLSLKVKHLALDEYYLQETKAPVGYQIDKTKHEVNLTYKDQETKVVTKSVTSKENVIKFNLDGFKYLDSKSGDSKSGYNGIEFELAPVDPTKGETRKSTTETDANGYDGYWSFKDVPYGDYTLSEVKAPAGYKKIKDLHVQSSFDAEKRDYTFTITEDGQKEPIKTLTVPESKINEGSNVISLSKLFFTNKVVKAPQINTLATSNGERTYIPAIDTPMHDKINLKDLEKGEKYTLKNIKLWRIQNKDYKNATVVYETEKDFVAEAENMEMYVETIVDTSKDDANTSYVWTEDLYKDGLLVAEHNDLTEETQTMKPLVPEEPGKVETLYLTADGKNIIDVTKDTDTEDTVYQEFPESQLGKTKYWVQQVHLVDAKGKSTVVETIEETREVKATKEEFKVPYKYLANTLKADEQLVFTHIVYNDKEHTDEYTRHYDLTNKKQTLTGYKASIETLYLTVDGKDTFDVTKDCDTQDKVSQEFPEMAIGSTKYWVQQVHKIDANGKDTVLKTIEEAREVKATTEEFNVAYKYLANTLKAGEKLVFTHLVYNDKEHTDEFARHFDLTNTKQTLTGYAPETPAANPSTPKTSTTGRTTLPQTAGTLGSTTQWILLALVVATGALFVLVAKNQKKKENQ